VSGDRAAGRTGDPTARLGREDLDASARDLARRLLHARLVVVDADGRSAGGRIVETEAYLGGPDLAAHSRLGRRTARTEVMFGPAGVAYVYLVYGMHHCFNVVAGPEGTGAAVLVRAIEPERGLERMRERRPACRRDRELGAGPGRVCAALGIDRGDGGVDLATSPRIRLEPVDDPGSWPVRRGPRIGVGYAGRWADARLRFRLDGHPCLSRPG
jgi:DNA-3-methyladenine glycosylase